MKNLKYIFASVLLLIAPAVMGQTVITSTTLSSAVSDSKTQTIVVASATGINAPSPVTGNTGLTAQTRTALLIDTEVMLVTGVNSTTITVSRGYDKTFGAPHSSGATVFIFPFNGAAGNVAGPLRKYMQTGNCTATNELYLPKFDDSISDPFYGWKEDCFNSSWNFSLDQIPLYDFNLAPGAARSVSTGTATVGTASSLISQAGGGSTVSAGTAGAGGTMTLGSGAGGADSTGAATGGAGGLLSVTAGAGGGTITGGTGGAVAVAGGAGGSGSTTAGTGGAASLTGGAAVSTAGTAGVGGAASVVGGVGSPNTATSGTGGVGGAASMAGGAGGADSATAGTGGAGGAASVTGGAGGGTITGGAGGLLTLGGGNGANGSTAGGAGGGVTINGGNAGTGGTPAGGVITLSPGTPTSTGATGFVVVAGAAAGAHFNSTQTTKPSAGGTCTTPAVANGSTDFAGQVSSASCTSGQTMTATFNKAYGTAPICVVSPANAAAAVTASAGAVSFASASTTVLTVTSPATASTAGAWNYICTGSN